MQWPAMQRFAFGKGVSEANLVYSIKPARLDPIGSEVKEVSSVILDSGEQILIGDYWFVAGPKE
jgi:hypothetical protein